MTPEEALDAAIASAGGAEAIVGRSSAPDGVMLVRGTDIRPEPIAWLWKDWLALGKLHLLAGAPGQGKTTLALAAVATVTSGGRWPDGTRCPAGNALIWSGEDDPADTLLPRLIAMGADRERIFFIKATRLDGEVLPFDPARDLVQLTEAAKAIGDVRLLIVDPVVSAVAGDSHKNSEVRRGLQPLVDLASALGAAVLGVSHLSKGTAGRDPTERVTGSIAFTAVVRIVLLAAKVKGAAGEPDRRILLRSKSNIGPDDGGFEYAIGQRDIGDGISASSISWGAAIDGTARELLAEAEHEEAGKTAKESATDWLAELLTGSPVPSDTVKSEAIAAGYSWATVRRAADELAVLRRKGGMHAGWYWSMPACRQPVAAEGAHESSKVLTLSSEHLRPELSTFAAAETERL